MHINPERTQPWLDPDNGTPLTIAEPSADAPLDDDALPLPPERRRPLHVQNSIANKRREDRSGLVMLRQLCGYKLAEIAKEFGLSVTTISKDLAYAREQGYVTIARDHVVGLVPKALAVLEAHLEENADKDIAMKILEGVGVLGKSVRISTDLPPNTESFEMWRAKIVRKAVSTVDSADGQEGDGAAAIGALPIIDTTAEAVDGEDHGSDGVADTDQGSPTPAGE